MVWRRSIWVLNEYDNLAQRLETMFDYFFWWGEAPKTANGGTKVKEPTLSMNAGQTQNLSTRYSLRPLFNVQLDEDVLYVRLHRFRSDG
jgi:hypothetical protein